MQSDEQKLEQQRKGRMVLLLMVVFFMVPMLVVIAMYKFNWKPAGDSYGELVKPPHAIDNASQLLDSAGNALPALLWKDKWSIVYISDDCPAKCQTKLHDMRQLHVSLYKDVIRVQRVWLTKLTDADKLKQIKKEYPELMIINQPHEQLDRLIQQFQDDDDQIKKGDQFYLVDPLGFYMMQYAEDIPLAHVRKDMVKLLKSSWAG